DRADNRVSDLEQFAVLAARYDSLERLLAELLLAGDVYGMDTIAATDPGDVLVLSTVHQAKGLEWSHVFVIRLIEDSFPHRRAIDEPGGEEEERRIFYVAVSRAMNELTLTYPSTITRGGYSPLVFTTPAGSSPSSMKASSSGPSWSMSLISSRVMRTRTAPPSAFHSGRVCMSRIRERQIPRFCPRSSRVGSSSDR